jgi:hypothetical protein
MVPVPERTIVAGREVRAFRVEKGERTFRGGYSPRSFGSALSNAATPNGSVMRSAQDDGFVIAAGVAAPVVSWFVLSWFFVVRFSRL